MKYHPEKILHHLGIPEEVISEVPIFEMQKFNWSHITNYKNIIELTEERIRIAVEDGEYTIEGRNLSIRKANFRELVIQGWIRELSLKRNI